MSSLLIAVVLMGAVQIPASAQTYDMTPEPQANTTEAALEIQADEFAEAFAFVDDIPAELIENSTDEELMDYVQAMDAVPGQTTKPGVATRADILGCSAAIATVIAGCCFPRIQSGQGHQDRL